MGKCQKKTSRRGCISFLGERGWRPFSHILRECRWNSNYLGKGWGSLCISIRFGRVCCSDRRTSFGLAWPIPIKLLVSHSFFLEFSSLTCLTLPVRGSRFCGLEGGPKSAPPKKSMKELSSLAKNWTQISKTDRDFEIWKSCLKKIFA